jgi:hypothetical protein
MNTIASKTAIAVLLLSLPLAATANRSEAQTALTQATSGVAAAERTAAGARNEAATVELDLAREQLLQAQRACERRDWEQCERAARRAHADSRLAEARTRHQNAEATTLRIEAAVETLRAELARQGA